MWVRINDETPYHPKLIEAGPVGLALWLCGLCYSARFHTDGFIPEKAIASLGLALPPVELLTLTQRLIAVGLWERAAGGFMIHDWSDYNISKQDWQSLRSKRAKAGRKGGKKSGEVRRLLRVVHSSNPDSKKKKRAKQNRSKSEADLDLDLDREAASRLPLPFI